jgi:four helix bundle protein
MDSRRLPFDLMDAGETRTFEELECWKSCRELRRWVRRSVLNQLPPDEKYLLMDQLIRSSRSATANIAEGHGRYHFKDNAKFCRNARGSCFEILDHPITALDEGYISEQCLAEGRELINHSVRLLNGYVAYLTRSARNAAD